MPRHLPALEKLERPALEPRTDKLAQAGRAAATMDYFKDLFDATADASDNAIICKDLDGVISSWNGAAGKLFGYAPEEMVGQNMLRLIPEDLHHEEQEILRKIRAGERIDQYETVRLRKDGKKIEVCVTISPVKNAEGRVVGASKVVRDLSDRKSSDNSRFRLAAIVDSADDAIISKDLNGIIQTWNQGAQRMFGYTAEEMIGKPLLRLIPKDLYYEEDEILRKLRAGERIDHYETTRLTKGGEPVEVSVTISPILNAKGEVTGASKIARNISDRKRTEKILIQSEKIATTGRMAATIAHEINNPLESVMNLIYLARENRMDPEKTLAHLLMAESELERVSHIARQTLGYYRDTGSPSEVYLHDLIQNVLSVYGSKILANGIKVETNFSDLRKIRVSSGEMLQIFSNVVTNSIDAMRQGGKLSIDLRNTITPSRRGVRVTIEDTGTGIPPENLSRVFEPFFTTKGNLGTGIGLWVAKQLAERRGGEILLTSSAEPGKSGTVVSIYLPFEYFEINNTRGSDVQPSL
jgi:PAS domain S-box-containing protein